jgi:hypothetical protein
VSDQFNSCGRQCFVIGGPWISEDPECPEHGAAGKAAREERDARIRREALEEAAQFMRDSLPGSLGATLAADFLASVAKDKS